MPIWKQSNIHGRQTTFSIVGRQINEKCLVNSKKKKGKDHVTWAPLGTSASNFFSDFSFHSFKMVSFNLRFYCFIFFFIFSEFFHSHLISFLSSLNNPFLRLKSSNHFQRKKYNYQGQHHFCAHTVCYHGRNQVFCIVVIERLSPFSCVIFSIPLYIYSLSIQRNLPFIISTNHY